jgi:hypothetical protein
MNTRTFSRIAGSLLALTAFSVLVTGCSKKEEEPAAPATSANAPVSGTAPAGTDANVERARQAAQQQQQFMNSQAAQGYNAAAAAQAAAQAKGQR